MLPCHHLPKRSYRRLDRGRCFATGFFQFNAYALFVCDFPLAVIRLTANGLYMAGIFHLQRGFSGASELVLPSALQWPYTDIFTFFLNLHGI